MAPSSLTTEEKVVAGLAVGALGLGALVLRRRAQAAGMPAPIVTRPHPVTTPVPGQPPLPPLPATPVPPAAPPTWNVGIPLGYTAPGLTPSQYGPGFTAPLVDSLGQPRFLPGAVGVGVAHVWDYFYTYLPISYEAVYFDGAWHGRAFYGYQGRELSKSEALALTRTLDANIERIPGEVDL